jgi:hypothetical protein
VDLARVRIACQRLLETGNGFVQATGLGQRNRQVGVRLRVPRAELQRLLTLGNRFARPAALRQCRAQIAVRLGVPRAQLRGLFQIRNGVVQLSRTRQRDAQVGVPIRIVRLGFHRLAVMRHGFVGPAHRRQQHAQVALGFGILGTQRQRFVPLRNGGVVLLLIAQFRCHVEQPVELRSRRIDMRHAVRRDVDELRNIHGAVGGGRVFDQDGRAVVAILVQVGQVHLRVGRPRFRREDQPAAIRRKAVP